MRRIRRLLVVGALFGVVGGGATPAADAAPSPQAPTTDCRVHVQGTHANGDRFNAEIQPLVRPFGRGPSTHSAADGTVLKVKADTLLCRRDGGTVPEHGGANIADFTGTGTMRRPDGTSQAVSFQAHVEDRGEGENNANDYWAIRALDADGNEVFFAANYLASGTVKLIPVASV